MWKYCLVKALWFLHGGPWPHLGSTLWTICQVSWEGLLFREQEFLPNWVCKNAWIHSISNLWAFPIRTVNIKVLFVVCMTAAELLLPLWTACLYASHPSLSLHAFLCQIFTFLFKFAKCKFHYVSRSATERPIRRNKESRVASLMCKFNFIQVFWDAHRKLLTCMFSLFSKATDCLFQHGECVLLQCD